MFLSPAKKIKARPFEKCGALPKKENIGANRAKR
jgi:hypothetical protein